MTEAQGSWSPILDERLLQEEARAIVDRVVALLREDASAPANSCDDPGLASMLGSPFLDSGLPGAALLLAYAAADSANGEDLERAHELLERAVQLVDDTAKPALDGGISGLGWVIEHIRSVGAPEPPAQYEEDANAELDQALLEYLQGPNEFDSDLLAGTTGVGVYCLERLPRPCAQESLRVIVRRLAESADRRAEGLAWRQPVDPGPDASDYPDGIYNLGMAHGIPAIIGLLARIHAAEIERSTTFSMLEGAIEWLLGRQMPTGASLFPNFCAPDREPEPSESRVSWCYGDLGVATSLMLAARLVGRSDWHRHAVRVARAAAERDWRSARVMDTRLCHGSAGNAHLFNRLYQASRDDRLRRAALYWYRATLQRFPAEVATGLELRTSHASGLHRDQQYSLYNGVLGVALALLGAISRTEPNWDRLLMACIPPASRP